MYADGSEQTRLTTNNTDDDFPRWSPDGSQIAFSSRRTGRDQIYIMNVDGGQVRGPFRKCHRGWNAIMVTGRYPYRF